MIEEHQEETPSTSIIDVDEIRRRILIEREERKEGREPSDPVTTEELKAAIDQTRKGRQHTFEAGKKKKKKSSPIKKDASLDDLLNLDVGGPKE